MYVLVFFPFPGSILLKNVSCIGSDYSLDDWDHNDWGQTQGCTHANDVGVVCTDSKLL